jgi:hypothetical protein
MIFFFNSRLLHLITVMSIQETYKYTAINNGPQNTAWGYNTATDGKNTQNAYTKIKHYTTRDLTLLKDRSCSATL